MFDKVWHGILYEDLHRDLRIQLASGVIKEHAIEHSQQLRSYGNNEEQKLIDISNITSRLKRVKPNNLLT